MQKLEQKRGAKPRSHMKIDNTFVDLEPTLQCWKAEDRKNIKWNTIFNSKYLQINIPKKKVKK